MPPYDAHLGTYLVESKAMTYKSYSLSLCGLEVETFAIPTSDCPRTLDSSYSISSLLRYRVFPIRQKRATPSSRTQSVCVYPQRMETLFMRTPSSFFASRMTIQGVFDAVVAEYKVKVHQLIVHRCIRVIRKRPIDFRALAV